jgi:ribosomal protein S18 acetylase RimI-like enzyme
MQVSARPAVSDDLPVVETLYGLLAAEMEDLEEVWPIADGLPDPVAESLQGALEDPAADLLVGCIDGFPLGFLLGRRETLLPQAGGAEVAAVRLIFTDPQAREVGVGEAMLAAYLERQRAADLSLFDAHVTPGHRLAKNFFESAGFSARRIVMNRDDRRAT